MSSLALKKFVSTYKWTLERGGVWIKTLQLFLNYPGRKKCTFPSINIILVLFWGSFVVLFGYFFFLVQGEHSVYLELDYFILFRCQRSTSVFLGETEEHKNGSARPDQGSVQPRILLLPAASSRCSEQSTEKTGPVPRAPSRCPCRAPSTRWSQGFLSWSCSWTAVFDSP